MNAAALKPISAERMGTIAPGKFKPADTPSLFDIVEAAEGAEVAAEFRRGYLSGAETERLFDEVAAAVAAGTYASATRVPSAAQFCGDEWESELSATVTPIRPKPEDKPKPLPALSQHIGDILAHPTTVRWLKRDEIERGVVAVMSGPRGSCKTASARRWVMHVAAVLGEPVLIFNGEGTGIDRQINGEIKRHYPHIDPATLPIYVVNKRMDLNGEKGRQAANAELTRIQTETGKRPALCVIDTFSKFHFGLQEKDNAAVSLFISGIDAAIRRAFDCTVLIVTHTGYADQTRARGASALEADTDSAYVVSKDPAGIVRVSRERFKDSAELPPLTFKPEIIDLGYKDAVGVAVTTISLAPTTECPKYQAKQQQPNGKNQIAAFETIKELSPLCDPVDFDDVIEAALARREIDATAETRRDMRKAIRGLAGKRMVWVDGEQCGNGALRPRAEEFENVGK